MAVRLVEAKDGVMQLVVSLRKLPLVSMDALNVQPFKRLARLADAHGSIPTARIHSLATRLSVMLPSNNGASDLGNGAGEMGLAAGGARAIGHHPGAGVPEGGAGRRQAGRNFGRPGRHRSFRRAVGGGCARGEASGLGGGGVGGGCWSGV